MDQGIPGPNPPQDQRLAIGLGAGFLLLVAAWALRWWVLEANPGLGAAAFIPAVATATLLGGMRAGLTLALLSGLAAVSGPDLAWPPASHRVIGALGGWLVLSGLALLIQYLVRAVEAQRAARAELARQAEQRRLMFHELQHRVANNLQFVSGLLALEASRARDPAAAQAALQDARRRLADMASLHRRLHDPDAGDHDLPALLREVCEAAIGNSGATGVSCSISVAATLREPAQLLAVTLIVAEAATNACKHAFGQGRGGRLAVLLADEGEEHVLAIRDDGPGFPPGAAAHRSLGTAVLQSLASQLHGRLSLLSDGGAVVRVAFPRSSPQ